MRHSSVRPPATGGTTGAVGFGLSIKSNSSLSSSGTASITGDLTLTSEQTGISGVAVLAESHVSVHTWPERGYAAFDIFMCGNADPHKAYSVLEQAFAPKRIVRAAHMRGRP